MGVVVGHILRSGVVKFTRNLSVWWGLYLVKLALAMMVALPLLVQIHADLENSRYAEALLKDWSFGVIAELAATRPNLTSSLLLFLVMVAVLALVVKQFLNGGIYSAFLRSEVIDMRAFFGECAVQFAGNIKISLMMAPIYFVILIAGTYLARLVPGDLLGRFGNALAYVTILKYIVVYVLVVLVGILSEFVRIRYCVDPGSRISDCMKAGLNFYRAHGVQSIGVYAVYFIPFVLLWLGIERLALVVTGGFQSMAGVVIELILFQVCSLARTGQSLLFTASVAPIAGEQFGYVKRATLEGMHD